ncbi:MAG: hypothetical protein GIW99_01730 [Candidatus Eremiobacteraeota bacterium]|nr:hypothetical protein [Candidatus Eremiobacteraeota bacterium]MBC5826397.1 hypothetical protein [Candidatus Eremiobacteraeota bacterium]
MIVAPLRRIVGWLVGCLALLMPVNAIAAQDAQAPKDQIITVSASRVEYFSDAGMIRARGAVRVTMAHGVTMEGDAFSMDLALRRFLVAGHVRLETRAGTFRGAAVAEFLAFRRTYFVPLEPDPDRWTFLNDDFAHPEKGRLMPGDAFFLRDFSGQAPYIVAKQAQIAPASYVKFVPARFVFLNGRLNTPPLPPYVYNFSANPDFGQNSLSGATFDAPYNFAGSTHALDAVHFRYDSQKKTYFSLEHHALLGDRGYAVFSLNPATQANKQWNLLAYERVGKSDALALNAQLFTDQHGLSQPRSANGFADVQFTQPFRQSSLTVDVTQEYDDLLGQSAARNHALIAGVAWSGFDQRIGRSGLTYRLQSGFARAHDAYGVSGSGLHDVWTHFLGASLSTPVYPGPFRSGISAIFRGQRTWLSFPNLVDSQSVQLSDGKRLTGQLSAVASYVVQSIAVRDASLTVASPNIALGLLPLPGSSNGLPTFDGTADFFPHAVDRSVVLSAAYAASPDFQATLTALSNHFSPALPAGIGPPKYHLAGDVRARISKTLFLDLGRQYYFNWAGRTFSPQFTLQVSAQ